MDFTAEIAMLETRPIQGYFCEYESRTWQAAGDLMANSEAPMEIRVRALRVIDRITGETTDDVSPEAIEQYSQQWLEIAESSKLDKEPAIGDGLDAQEMVDTLEQIGFIVMVFDAPDPRLN